MKPRVIDYFPIILNRLDRVCWQPVLKQGNDVVDKYFKNWQLGFGTLLGAVREKDQYIHHDFDLDIDVIVYPDEEDKIQDFNNEMEDNGFYLIRTQLFDYIGDELVMSLAYQKNGCIYDICFFRKFAIDFLHIGKDGIVIRPGDTESRKELDVQGVKCYIPILYDKYLKGRYGNWKIPASKKGQWYDDAKKGKLFIPLDFNTEIEKKYQDKTNN